MENHQFPNDVLEFLSTSPSCFGIYEPLEFSSPRDNRVSQVPTVDRADSIPKERFALVARLWPRKSKPFTSQIEDRLWAEVVNSPCESICTESDVSVPSTGSIIASESEPNWGLDEDKRQSLMRDIVDYPDDLNSQPETSFPSTRILNLGLDIAIRQSHSLVSFIHRPTFCAKSASNSILFALCLIGLSTTNSGHAKNLALTYLPVCFHFKFRETKIDPG